MYNASHQKRFHSPFSLGDRHFMSRVSPLQDNELSDLTKQEILYWSNKLQLSPSELFTLNDDELNERLNAAYYKICKENQLQESYNRFKKLETVRCQLDRLKGGGCCFSSPIRRTAWQILHEAATEIEKSYMKSICQSSMPQHCEMGPKTPNAFISNSAQTPYLNLAPVNATVEEAHVLYNMATPTVTTAGRDTTLNMAPTTMDSSIMHNSRLDRNSILSSAGTANATMGMLPVNRTVNNVSMRDRTDSRYEAGMANFARRSAPSSPCRAAANRTNGAHFYHAANGNSFVTTAPQALHLNI